MTKTQFKTAASFKYKILLSRDGGVKSPLAAPIKLGIDYKRGMVLLLDRDFIEGKFLKVKRFERGRSWMWVKLPYYHIFAEDWKEWLKNGAIEQNLKPSI